MAVAVSLDGSVADVPRGHYAVGTANALAGGKVFDVFKEDPAVEGSSVGPLAGRSRDNLIPGQAVGAGNGLENFQDVGQLRWEFFDWRLTGFPGLFSELLQKSCLVITLVEDTGDGPLSGRADDLRDAVTNQLVVRDLHDVDVTVNERAWAAYRARRRLGRRCMGVGLRQGR
jgi:hypothetical protein